MIKILKLVGKLKSSNRYILLFLIILGIFPIQGFGQTADEYYNMGVEKYNNGRYTEAIKLYDLAILVDPNNSSYYINRGVAKGALNNKIGAMDDYNKAIKINKPTVNIYLAYYDRANIKYENKNYNEAIKDFNASIELNSNYSNSYMDRGTCYYILNKKELAMSDYNKAIEINYPTEKIYYAYFNRALIKKDYEDYNGAINDFTIVIQLNPNHADSYAQRCFCNFWLKNYDLIFLDINKAIEISPMNGQYYFEKGIFEINLKQKDKGCADLRKAGELGHVKAYDAIKGLCNN